MMPAEGGAFLVSKPLDSSLADADCVNPTARLACTPREHRPPHVHVRNAAGEVVIELAVLGRPQTIRDAVGMRSHDVATAFWIVEEHMNYLLKRWRDYHG